MNHMELQFIKTDKNGTKYFYDWQCPRCGGAGFADKWIATGKTCWACGGSGKRSVAKIVKEYTPEYWAKLEARRIARQQKFEKDHADEIAQAKAERKEREATWRKEQTEYLRNTLGCNSEGIGYVLTGNTFRVKDKIRSSGGKWISQAWVCPVEFTGNGIRCIKMDISGFVRPDGMIHEQYVRDIVYCIGQKGMTFEQAKEQVADWNA